MKKRSRAFRFNEDKCIREAIENEENESKTKKQAQALWSIITEEEKKE